MFASRIRSAGIDPLETVVLPAPRCCRGQAARHEYLFGYPIPIAKIAAFVGES